MKKKFKISGDFESIFELDCECETRDHLKKCAKHEEYSVADVRGKMERGCGKKLPDKLRFWIETAPRISHQGKTELVTDIKDNVLMDIKPYDSILFWRNYQYD